MKKELRKGQLEDKVAIVTGGGTGIGEAICRKFAREGAMVVVNGLPGDPIDDVVEAIRDDGGDALAFAGDVSDDGQAKACVDVAVHEYGRLDILVNNAGVLLVAAETDKMPLDKFDEHVRCNIRTAFLMTRHALPHLRKTKGNIISAGSAAGVNGEPGATVYGGTKGFLHAFMAGVAVEQARYGVRANCVCPGPIDTAWTHKETGAVDEKIEKALVTSVPFGRRGTPEEAANVYAFLASDAASFVTGALWSVDGGLTQSKGAAGAMAGQAASTPPSPSIELHHSHDGTRNKEIVKLL
ncbi:MAG TPA: SDR family NAD(P)-dependent oxidoreductase [Gemmatimonadales bacterium]|jgi:NAD(P)-dependent dehydrogenase (short-subunit alcohol dehydrogenase family)